MPLGRPRRGSVFDAVQARRDEVARIEVERKFSQVKGSFGLGLVRARLQKTSECVIGLGIIALNVAHIVRRYFCLLFYLFKSLFKNLLMCMMHIFHDEKHAFIQ